MTQAHFTNQLNRLVETFGKAAYGNERLALIWREVQDFPDAWFRTVVDRFIGDSRQAPMLPEFRDEIAKFREKQPSQEKAWDGMPITGCTLCFGQAVYLCQHIATGALYAFRCHCERGVQDPRKQIPHFRRAHEADYRWVDGRVFAKERSA